MNPNNVHHHSAGQTCGLVGASGNAGSAIAQAIFFTPQTMSTQDAFKWMVSPASHNLLSMHITGETELVMIHCCAGSDGHRNCMLSTVAVVPAMGRDSIPRKKRSHRRGLLFLR